MTPLSDTSIDEDFFQDLTLLSRFDSKNAGYKNGIETDQLDVRNFFFNNSFNLLWKDKTNQDSPAITGNAFLLNVLLPDWITPYHNEYTTYSPKNYVGGDEIVLLVGTSFSFANQLFDQIKDWKKEVNNNFLSPSLESKSKRKTSHKFLFSHPWPINDDVNPKLHQKNLYQLNDPNYSSFESDISRPYFIEIPPKDVEAVYAAVDLSVNSSLLNLTMYSKRRLQYDLSSIQNSKLSRVNWKDKAKDVYGNEYKLAVDFAVLKIKFHVNNIKKHFLDYFINLYKKTTRIPQILNTELEIKNDRTDAIYLGGWEPMNEKEIDYHTIENLFLKYSLKSGIQSINSKRPSECINDKCFDLKLFETYTQKLAANGNSPSESTNYELVEKEWFPNEEDGVLYVRYKVKNKRKGWVSPNQKELVIGGFISTITNSPQANLIKKYTEEKQESDEKLINFLEAKPKVHARWQEYGIKHSYFPFKSLRSHIFSETVFRKNKEDTTLFNQNTPLSIFSLNNQKYLNIAHHLDVPNMGLSSAKGMIAVMKHPDKQEKVMLGIYDGISSWSNPVAGKERKVGKVALFISPWRYDLFNSDNNLSKPSLGDILIRKKLHEKLIQGNRFRVKEKQPSTKKSI